MFISPKKHIKMEGSRGLPGGWKEKCDADSTADTSYCTLSAVGLKHAHGTACQKNIGSGQN